MTLARDPVSASSRRLRMPAMRVWRFLDSCSTRSISATARGMRCRPATDCSSSAREMSSAMSCSFISTSLRYFSMLSPRGHLLGTGEGTEGR